MGGATLFVCIHENDGLTALGQHAGDMDGHGRFSDPALPSGYSNDPHRCTCVTMWQSIIASRHKGSKAQRCESDMPQLALEAKSQRHLCAMASRYYCASFRLTTCRIEGVMSCRATRRSREMRSRQAE